MTRYQYYFLIRDELVAENSLTIMDRPVEAVQKDMGADWAWKVEIGNKKEQRQFVEELTALGFDHNRIKAMKKTWKL